MDVKKIVINGFLEGLTFRMWGTEVEALCWWELVKGLAEK